MASRNPGGEPSLQDYPDHEPLLGRSEREKAMKRTHAVLLGAAALWGFGATGALAGPCAEQLSQIEKTLSSKDAGSGPVVSGGGMAGQNATGQSAAGQTASNTEANTTREAGTKGGANTDPTRSMNQATSQTAASPQDVQRQLQGSPTASQAAGTSQSTGSGQTAESGSTADQATRIRTAFDRARQLDNQGSEACTGAVAEVEQLMGGQTR
jgi:hypothetical protein